jgi:hypothetical protein
MSLHQWFGSNVEYARKLTSTGIEGARHGQEEFLKGEPLADFLTEAARQALAPAVVGISFGALGACLSGKYSGRRKSVTGILAYGLLGGAIGFGAGLSRETQGLAARMALRTVENTRSVRDERWLKRNPINYA